MNEVHGSDWVTAFAIAVIAQLGFIAMMQTPERPPLMAEISDEKAQPIAVSITPVMPKLGDPKAAAMNPWARKVAPPPPKPDDTPRPSTHANPTEVVSAHVPFDAGRAPEPTAVDAGPVVPVADASPTLAASEPSDASSTSPGVGDPHGAPDGSAEKVDECARKLVAWSRNAQGTIDTSVAATDEKWKGLVLTVTFQLAGRAISGFSVAGSTPEPTFDATVHAKAQAMVGRSFGPWPEKDDGTQCTLANVTVRYHGN